MQEQHSSAAGYRNKTVLVVVEQPSIRELISLNLRDGGFYPMAAADRTGAQELIAEVVPDAVVIDADSQAVDGVSLANELRQPERARYLPIMMLTSNPMLGADCDADACMGKPFSPHELVGRMVDLLRRTTRPSEPALRAGRSRSIRIATRCCSNAAARCSL